jgi:predicted nucleic acid-binding protein
MAASPKRICWDACAWIAYIQKEKIDVSGVLEDRHSLCRSVLRLAERRRYEIAVSGFCLVEVCKNHEVKFADDDKIAAFFENDYILLVPVDKVVGTKARTLMQKTPGLKPPDAVHLATALLTNSDEMHTFDGKLLGLTGKLPRADGTALRICKPGHGGPPLPLLDETRSDTGDGLIVGRMGAPTSSTTTSSSSVELDEEYEGAERRRLEGGE